MPLNAGLQNAKSTETPLKFTVKTNKMLTLYIHLPFKKKKEKNKYRKVQNAIICTPKRSFYNLNK